MLKQQQAIQKLIVLDLTLKVLEKDRQHIAHFKTVYAFSEWFELKMKEVHDDLILTRNTLLQQDIALINMEKIDKLTTAYTFRIKKGTQTFRYSNLALRNWTNEEVKRLLQIPYRSSDKIR